MFSDGYINRDGIPPGGQGVAMVTVTAIKLPYSSLLPPYLRSTSASTLLFSNKNMNKQSSLACSGNEAAQAFNHQWHLWIVGSTLGLLLSKDNAVFLELHTRDKHNRTNPSTPETDPAHLESGHCPFLAKTQDNDVLMPSTSVWAASLLSGQSGKPGLKSFIPSLQLNIINKMHFLRIFSPV